MSQDNMIKKIEALLAKANNTACTEEEAQAFNAKAHELMVKYNISRATLQEAGKKVERGHMTLEVQRRPWSESVLMGITKLYYCTWYSTSKGRSHVITIVGEKQNLAMCHAIAVMVLRSIQQAARLNGGGRSFMTGAGSEVYRRCAEMYAAAHSSTLVSASPAPGLITRAQSGALVALDTQERTENREYLASILKVNLKPARSTGPQIRDINSYRDGVAHGKTVQLRRNLLGHG